MLFLNTDCFTSQMYTKQIHVNISSCINMKGPQPSTASETLQCHRHSIVGDQCRILVQTDLHNHRLNKSPPAIQRVGPGLPVLALVLVNLSECRKLDFCTECCRDRARKTGVKELPWDLIIAFNITNYPSFSRLEPTLIVIAKCALSSS